MELKHKQRLLADFPGDVRYKRTQVLDIPDEYKCMDPERIESVGSFLDIEEGSDCGGTD